MPVAAGSLRQFRILAAALMGALVVIAIALAFVVSDHERRRDGQVVHTHAPGVWVYLVVLASGVLAAVLILLVGYRLPAITREDSAVSSGDRVVAAYQQAMFVRVALSEAVAIVSIALLFSVRSNTIAPYLLAALIAEILMAVHVWPSARLIMRVQNRLNRHGGNVDLMRVLDVRS